MIENDVKLLIETEQRSRLNAEQIGEMRKEMKEMQRGQNAIYELACSIKQIAEKIEGVREDVSEVKASQKELRDELTGTVTSVQNRIAEVENKPAKDTADVFNKVKIAIYTSIVTFLVTGVLSGVILVLAK